MKEEIEEDDNLYRAWNASIRKMKDERTNSFEAEMKSRFANYKYYYDHYFGGYIIGSFVFFPIKNKVRKIGKSKLYNVRSLEHFIDVFKPTTCPDKTKHYEEILELERVETSYNDEEKMKFYKEYFKKH